MLTEAAKHLPDATSPVTLLTNSGVENVNQKVDKCLLGGVLKRVLAQVENVESNFIVESYWQHLKRSRLFINCPDSLAAAPRMVTFYVGEYNEVMPHGVLYWRTPDEVCFGKGEDLPSNLEIARRVAREARIAANRTITRSTYMGSTPLKTAASEATRPA